MDIMSNFFYRYSSDDKRSYTTVVRYNIKLGVKFSHNSLKRTVISFPFFGFLFVQKPIAVSSRKYFLELYKIRASLTAFYLSINCLCSNTQISSAKVPVEFVYNRLYEKIVAII